jgi:hypothetical protein
MKLATGTVVEGKVVVDGPRLPEGAVVAVLARDEESFDLPADLEPEIDAALAEVERGELLSLDEVLRRLRAI